MDAQTQRQQLLFLWLEHSSLNGRVVAWAFHDGRARPAGAELEGEDPWAEPTGAAEGDPPYANGVAALHAGWRLLQAAPVPVRIPGAERVTGRLEHEFLFERIVDR